MYDTILNPDYVRHLEKNTKKCIPKPASLKLHVINPQEDGLEGAEFALFYRDSDMTCPYKKAVSNDKGRASFGIIPNGEYIMIQSRVPVGYAKNTHIYTVTATNKGVCVDGTASPVTIINLQNGPEPNPEPENSCELPYAGPSERDVDVLEVLRGINPDHQLSAINSIAINVEFDEKGNPVISAKGSSNHIVEDGDKKAFNLQEANLVRAVGIHRGKAPKHAFLNSPAPAGKCPCLFKEYGWNETNIHLAVESIKISNVSTSLATIATKTTTNDRVDEDMIFTAELTSTVSNTLSSTHTSTHGISASANIGVNIGVASAGVSLGYNYQWGQENKQESTIAFTTTDTVETVVRPGKSVMAKMIATVRKFTATVVYRAFLNGHTAYHYDSRFEDHYFWASPISSVMASANIPNSITVTEEIEVGFFSEADIHVYDIPTPVTV